MVNSARIRTAAIEQGSVHDVSRTAAILLPFCHLDRRRRSFATEEEWRDPDNVSFAMLMQGILTNGTAHGPLNLRNLDLAR